LTAECGGGIGFFSSGKHGRASASGGRRARVRWADTTFIERAKASIADEGFEFDFDFNFNHARSVMSCIGIVHVL
jgi:hypothetical protein